MKTPISKSKNKVGKTVGSPRRKRHNEAIAKPEVRAAVASLKVDWDRLSLSERGMRLQELLQAGCSTRGLEDELEMSEPSQRGIIVLESLERGYSVGLLGAKTEIPVQ